MRFKEFAGTSLVPLLSRLVLAAAFVTTGANKLFKQGEFTADQARVLRAAGVEVAGPELQEDVSASLRFVPVAFRQDADTQDGEGKAEGTVAPPPKDTKKAVEKAVDAVKDAAAAVVEDAEDAAGAVVEDAREQATETTDAIIGVPADAVRPDDTAPDDTASRYTARKMHGVTWMCAINGWPYPQYFALVAAVTEFLGGALLLIGFLSRIWALGIAVAMGVAFNFVSMNFNGVHTTNPFVFAENIPNFNTLFSQVGLFTLALGIVLTGPGPLSLDRVLFRRRRLPPPDYAETAPVAVVNAASSRDENETGLRPL